MRLTVRTLLAWIDETLGADDQAALGEKVAASGVAPRLVERITTVVAHPAVTAPAPVGRGLADDPNTAAEFLDNALDPERLEAFERVCVESDAHLADVAASHRILAEIARDAAVVEPLDGPRRRALLERARARVVTAARSTAGPRQPAGGGPVTPADAPRRRAPLLSWLSAAAAVALLAVLGGVFVWSLGRPTRRPEKEVAVAPRDQAPPPAVAAPMPADAPPAATDAPAAAATADVRPQVAATEVRPEVTQPAAASEPPPADPVPAVAPPAATDPPPTPVAPMPNPTAIAAVDPPAPPSAVDLRVPSGDALAIVAPPPGPTPAVDPAAAAAAPPRAAGDPATDALEPRTGGPLLHRSEIDGTAAWRPLAVDAPLAAREELLAPPWCHPVFAVDGVTVRLEPGTRAVLTRAADGRPTLEVVFGRAVVSATAADASLGVIAGGLRGVVSGVMERAAGIEVRFDRDPGTASISFRRASVHAGLGDKVWRQDAAAAPLAGLPPDVLLPARASIVWDERDPAAAMLAPPAESSWIAAVPASGRIERSAVRGLAAALDSAVDLPVAESLRPLLADRRLENRMIAAATQALIGEYDELVALLCAEPPLTLGEAQWTTLEQLTLPLAIARGDNSTAALAAAFRAAGPAGKGDLLMTLARGFSDDELAAGGDRLLVESLDDGSLAVRRFAIGRLTEIVSPDARRAAAYRADRPEQLRKDGIAWWKAQLDQGRIRRGGVPEPPARAAEAPPARDDE